jgi:uncharacterized membrane protein YoaK (UPF0700 family)
MKKQLVAWWNQHHGKSFVMTLTGLIVGRLAVSLLLKQKDGLDIVWVATSLGFALILALIDHANRVQKNHVATIFLLALMAGGIDNIHAPDEHGKPVQITQT